MTRHSAQPRRLRALALFVAAAATPAAAFSPVLARMRDAHIDALRAGGAAVARARLAQGLGVPPDQYFQQTLDHFDVLNNLPGTAWPQRFWVNSSFFDSNPDKANAPVVFYVEGEGAGSPYSVLGGEHVALAETYGALIVALEHRGYGASIPTSDLTTSNMRFITSHQAIADIALFATAWLAPTYNLSFATNKLVTFGGSYPGVLSAWARLRLPHIVHTAVSTSSPVQSVVDYTLYNDVCARSFSYPLVGGSPACTANIASAFAAIDAAFTGSADARHAMATKLMSCTGLDAVNDTMWAASNYASLMMGIVQYNRDGGSGLNIRNVCATMTQAGVAPIDAFAQVVAKSQGSQCMDNAYADYLVQLRNTVVDKGAGGLGLRSWTWQTCAQFAFYQSCEDGTLCPFSKLMTLESSYAQCQDGFGDVMSNQLNDAGVAFTNAYLGGQRIAGSRIIFVNGDVDPWHALSVYPGNNVTSFDPLQPTVFIPGGSHCSNMGTPSDSDPPALVAAHAEIDGFLSQFLAL